MKFTVYPSYDGMIKYNFNGEEKIKYGGHLDFQAIDLSIENDNLVILTEDDKIEIISGHHLCSYVEVVENNDNLVPHNIYKLKNGAIIRVNFLDCGEDGGEVSLAVLKDQWSSVTSFKSSKSNGIVSCLITANKLFG